MDKFDQLLTCCICLDRYRTPKLLPCQHSYCMEPCMEGLVDYVKRQVKLWRKIAISSPLSNLFTQLKGIAGVLKKS